MGAILSSKEFSVNDRLWARLGSNREEDFSVTQRDPGGHAFEDKPLSSVNEVSNSFVEETLEEVLLTDEEVEESDISEETSELTITMLESEYQNNIEREKNEARSELRKELATTHELQMNTLIDQQKAFFETLIGSLEDTSVSTSIASLSLKLGELLARTQINLDETTITDFIQNSINEHQSVSSEFVTIRVSESWQQYVASLEERLPDGIDILLDETLHPGDLIVNAGQGGYYDLLEERIKNIQDQLRSVENTNSSEWLAESFREFLSSDNFLDSESAIDSDSPETSIETDSYGSTIEDEGFSKIRNEETRSLEGKNPELNPNNEEV